MEDSNLHGNLLSGYWLSAVLLCCCDGGGDNMRGGKSSVSESPFLIRQFWLQEHELIFRSFLERSQ